MPDAETIARNTVLLSFGEIGTRALSFVLVVAIAQYLGDAGLGAFAFAFAFTDLLLNAIDLGLPTYVMREMAKNRQASGLYMSNVLGLRLLMLPIIPAIALAMWAIAVFLLHAATSETWLIVTLATAGMALNFLTDPFRMVFVAHEKDAYYSGLIIFERLIFTASGLGLLITGHGLIPVVSMYAVSQLISFFTTTYFVRSRFTGFTIKLEKPTIIPMVKKALWFWLATFLRMVYQRADTILLGIMQGLAVTGWYGAAYRITESLRFIPLVVIPAVFPAMSRLHTQSKESLKALYEKTFYYLLIAALPMAVGLTLTASKVIAFFYGRPEFQHSAIALQLLIWAEALLFLHFIMGFLLNAIDKQHLFTIATAAYAAANVALNLVMIPKYSYVGAGIAAVITQAIAVVTLYSFCAMNGYGLNIAKLIYKPAIACAAMAATLTWLGNFPLLATVPAAAAVYAATLIALKGIGKEELELARKMILGSLGAAKK